MNRRALLAVLAQAPLAMAGCQDGGGNGDGGNGNGNGNGNGGTGNGNGTGDSTATPGGEPDLSATVDWPFAGVRGHSLEVLIEVQNAGGAAGEFSATLTGAGDDLDDGSVTVDPGDTATLTLTGRPGSAGDFEFTAAGESQTLTVYDNALVYVHDAMATVKTVKIDKQIQENGLIDFGEGATSWEKTATGTVEVNYDAETKYRKIEADNTYGNKQRSETVERWILGETFYQKTVDHTENETIYNSGATSVPTPSTVLDIHGPSTQGFLSTNHSSDEFVFVFNATDSEEASDLMRRVIGSGGELPARKASDGRLELRYDRRTGRATKYVTDLTLKDADLYPELDRTVTDEYTTYGATVDVQVPQDVKDNTA